MMTTAIPDGEDDPTIFVLDVRDRPWDGTAGLTLIAEWDGVGMAATQSHAMRLEGAARGAAGLGRRRSSRSPAAAGPLVATLFTVGDPRRARRGGRRRPRPGRRARPTSCAPTSRSSGRGPSWTTGSPCRRTRARCAPIESGRPASSPSTRALRAKQAVADLAEQTLLRITRVIGGGTFSQRSPFAHWFEDVRALGFLRPPWGLAYDGLFATSLS